MNFGRGVIQIIKDCLFSVFCLECQVEGQWWCETCLKKKNIEGVFYCPVCHISNHDGQPCGCCQAASPLNGVVAFLDYSDKSTIGQLIHHYKYDFAFDIVLVWEKMIKLYFLKIFKSLDLKNEVFTIIPVPLHKKRERVRGFNQANLIGKLIFEEVRKRQEVCFDNENLTRNKNTLQQAKLNRADRLNNLKQAFVWNDKKLAPRNVLLIDDVYTSGATMQECARVLKNCGAKKVYGFTLTRD